MNKALTSLALLKANWDTLKKDYIESFVPFVVTLISRQQYNVIDVNTICRDFQAEYDLAVPYLPMITILNRLKRQGYIRKGPDGCFLPIRDKIAADDFSEIAAEQERKYRKVIDEFLRFCNKSFGEVLTEEEAEAVFISFLRDHDLDVLFMSQDRGSLLPEVTSTAVHRFLVNSFVKNAHESEPNSFAFILDVSVGHIISNTLLYRNYERFQGKLTGASLYLDIAFLFNAMGTNGLQMQEAYVECIRLLSMHNARLFIFQHTYNEFRGILDRCLQWIDSNYFDPAKANRALIYFRDSGFTASDVEQFILSIDQRLAGLGIEVVDTPHPNGDRVYQIDENSLQAQIVEVYRSSNPYFDEEEKDYTLYQDVRSISAIYRLRRGQVPARLRDAKHIFVTANSSLAYAAMLFEIRDLKRPFFSIPVALTDVFIGTLVWINHPSTASINEKRLIANCYAALQPSKMLVKRLVDEAERLKREGEITEDDMTVLKESRVARNLLQAETLGDPTRFTDKTSLQILDEIRAEIKREEGARFGAQRAELQQQIQEQRRLTEYTEERLSTALSDSQRTQRNIERLADRTANVVGVVFYIVSIAVVVITLFFQFYPDLVGDRTILRYLLVVVALVLFALNLITGFNVRGARDIFKAKLRKKVIRILGGNLAE